MVVEMLMCMERYVIVSHSFLKWDESLFYNMLVFVVVFTNLSKGKAK